MDSCEICGAAIPEDLRVCVACATDDEHRALKQRLDEDSLDDQVDPDEVGDDDENVMRSAAFDALSNVSAEEADGDFFIGDWARPYDGDAQGWEDESDDWGEDVEADEVEGERSEEEYAPGAMSDRSQMADFSRLCLEEQIAYIIVECVAVMEDSGVSVGREKMADLLRGKPSRFVLEHGYERNPAFGRLEFLRLSDVRFMIQALVDDGLLGVTSADPNIDLPVLTVTPRGRAILTFESTHRVRLPWKLEQKILPDYSADVLRAVRDCRTDLAASEGVRPYVIVDDRALFALVVAMPRTLEALSQVHGWGHVKVERYGERFLDAMRSFWGDATSPRQDHRPDVPPEGGGLAPSPVKPSRPPSTRPPAAASELVTVELEGKSYTWNGARWYGTHDHIIPPGVVRSRLHALISDRLAAEDDAISDLDELLRRADAARLEGHDARALRLAMRVREARPDHAGTAAVLSSILREMRQPEKALEVAEPFRRSGYPPILTSRAAALCDLGRWQEALAQIRQVLAIGMRAQAGGGAEALAVHARIKANAPELVDE